MAILIFTGFKQDLSPIDVFQAVRRGVGSWALLLGLLVTVSALFRIALEARMALRQVGWAMIPLIARSLLTLKGTVQARPQALDLYEMATVLICAMMLRWQPGGSFKKAIFTTLALGVALIIIGRIGLLP